MIYIMSKNFNFIIKSGRELLCILCGFDFFIIIFIVIYYILCCYGIGK